MIFFSLTLAPVDIPVPPAPSRELVGVVFAPVENIEAASPLVVKGLYAAGWRILNVIEARSLRPSDPLLLNAAIATLHTRAEETGFAFSVDETTTVAAPPKPAIAPSPEAAPPASDTALNSRLTRA